VTDGGCYAGMSYRFNGSRLGVSIRTLRLVVDTAGLSPSALHGERVAVISSTTAPYPAALAAITGLGATTAVKTVGTPSPNPPSIVMREFKRDLNAKK
jgi:hypothetical protein